MSIVLLAPTSDGGFAPTDTVSLREIEQEVARRVGPFMLRTVNTGSTLNTVNITALRSSMDLGGLEDMFVLRRGRLTDGTLLPQVGRPFVGSDRIRLVRQYRPAEGVVEVDYNYTYATYEDEEVEFHHLHPEQELRPAVLAGLRRCYVVHRLAVDATATVYGTPIDLTELAPWLLTRDQVYRVSCGGGAPLNGWRVEGYGGGLYLNLSELSYGSAYVTNRRPATSMVLPEDAATPIEGDDWIVRSGNVNEPWGDEDRFAVPMDYAAAAGHIEAWRTARPRLSATAQTGMWADQKEVAAEFTRVATIYFDPPRYETGMALGGLSRGTDLSNAS